MKRFLALLALSLLFYGCGQGVNETQLTVFAASSLAEAFQETSAEFAVAYPDVKIALNFAGSSTLRTQLELGAQADVFASADAAQMELARSVGIVKREPKVFASNSLVIITPADAPVVTRLEDLSHPGLRLVLAQPAVPVGAYARQALQKMEAATRFGDGFEERVLANVVSLETNVSQVVAKVATGEVDAGVVYSTSVAANSDQRLNAIPIPDAFNVDARYVIAVTSESGVPQAAQAFVDFLLSADGQAILGKHGFGPPQ